MRVVQVSAHFPPNFVSGGTLVPQRVARAVAAAGHESYVYAGHLDDALAPLTTWTDHDGDVSVRWVVTTPWTGWSDPRNSHNPAVEQDFRAWLHEVRPDVVHVHSLQTLGGSLVTAAREAGARVVVTMHDFWWFCARQFLVDRDMRPCSLVVDCGSCACEVDHDWLTRRNAVLAPALEAAHLVLAPSASAARVLVANGVPADKVEVDENGLTRRLPDATGTATGRAARNPGEPVRFMFAGGQDPMKGVDVLLDAARRLGHRDGWLLDLYGVRDGVDDALDGRARTRPAYRPDELDAVLSQHDVLVLPSVMRESHSILTREALGAGLAVVCTDTLGPEEAVVHGENGLVVPAGDAEALAGAMERFLDDHAWASRAVGRGAIVPVRDFEDQARGLLEIYERLRAAGDRATDDAAGGERDAHRIGRVAFVVGIQGAPLRYRAHLPAEALRLQGVGTTVHHYRDPAARDAALGADAVVLYRVPATRQILDLVAEVRAHDATVPVLYDVDDLIFDPELRGQVDGLAGLDDVELELWWRGVARYRTTMEQADLFIGSTRELCRHATAVTGLPARQFANGVGALLARASERALGRPRKAGPLRIGYFSGTTTHDADWASVEPAVLEVMHARPDVELWLGGHLQPTAALEAVAPRVRRLPFVPWHELPQVLRDVDVCLAPLTGNGRFNEAKSAIKWLEAALVETPVVASPTEPFREAVEQGRTGFLAAGHDDWVGALDALLDDVVLRRRVGSLARREALLRWSPHLQGKAYLDNLHAAAAIVRAEGPRSGSTWEPVFDDEPWSAADSFVEPYEVPSRRGRVPAAVSSNGLVRRAAAARRVYRRDGLTGLVRKVVRRTAKRRAS